MAIDKLQPAPKEQLVMYAPYYPQQGKKSILPYAFSLYKTGALEGERKIEGGESIPFIATWNVSTLPADSGCGKGRASKTLAACTPTRVVKPTTNQ